MSLTTDRLRFYRKNVNELKQTAHGIAVVLQDDRNVNFTAQTVEGTAALLCKFIDRLIIEYGGAVPDDEASPPSARE